jgi:zinc transporter ZupT
LKELLILFITPIVGAFLVFIVKDLKNFSVFLLTFSGAYLVSLVFLHILPDIYQSGGNQIGFFIIGGFFLQVLLDYTSKGIEHGHVHIERGSMIGGILIGLFLHAFIEGIPLGMGNNVHYSETHSLFFGIVLHKLPISLVLTTFLFSRNQNIRNTILFIFLFAIMTPLGYLYGYYFSGYIPIGFDQLMAIVVGIFLHVGTTIIFESSDSHRINFKKLFAILIGFAVSGFLS